MAYALHSPAAINRHNLSIITVTNTHYLLSNQFISYFNYSSSKFISSSLLPPRNTKLRRHRCGASSPHPPSPPPESGPPPGDEPDSNSGSIASFSRLQESVQIFFAVFFWMSLFFWSSVWDGRNNGRSDKGPPRFWK